MTRKRNSSSILNVFGNLGWPLLCGLALTSLFYMLILQGPLASPLARRYFASHPVSFFATGMFGVGIAALLLKLREVLAQFAALKGVSLGAVPAGAQPAADADELLETLREQTRSKPSSVLARRLEDALTFVRRQGSAKGLDEELRYLADMDAARQHESLSLVRIIIWATPTLGFLGTVIGITKALGDLDPTELANSIQTAMKGLLAGLYVAFDTTTLALSLSIVLMFVQFLVERLETQLLTQVDDLANDQLLGRFQEVGSHHDPYLESVERMAAAVVKTSEVLVQQQSRLWQSTIEAAHQQWVQLGQSTTGQLQTALAGALDGSLEQFAATLAEREESAAGRAQHRWEQWQTTLSDNARLLHDQQKEMARQTELLNEVIRATGDVKSLEQSLNENLKSLASAGDFEQVAMSLAAAVHLLNGRLGAVEPPARVELNPESPEVRAA